MIIFKVIVKHMLFIRQFCFNSSAVLCVALAVLLAGCEGEKDDPTGVDSYFKTNAYSSAERDDPLPPTMEIAPTIAAVGIVGQEVIFTASGGEGSYHWYLANEAIGELNSHGADQAAYKCKQVGNNTVTVQDDNGHYASAQITPATDKMTVTPAAITLASGALYASFTVSGGTPPYTWTSGNASMGTVSYSASTSYTAGYTAVAGAYGQNTITVRDAEDRIATATVTQSAD